MAFGSAFQGGAFQGAKQIEDGMKVNTITANSPALAELPVWGGKKVGEVNPHALAAWGIKSGVPGMSHEFGLQQNVNAYAAHLEAIAKVAGDAAVAEWVAKHPKED